MITMILHRRSLHLGLLLLAASLPRLLHAETAESPPANKYLEMHRLAYLPFTLEFEAGTNPMDILPLVPDESGKLRRLTLSEWEAVNREWNALREIWTRRSLLLTTEVPLNGSVHISGHLISHRVPITERGLDKLPLVRKVAVTDEMRAQPAELQSEIRQREALKSFLGPFEDERFNFFVISASWCASCQTYRVLLESYLKQLALPGLNFHSVVVEDPRLDVFRSGFLQDLFPDPERYPQESVPRFIALQNLGGEVKVWQEGDALAALYRRFLAKHRGFLDARLPLAHTNLK